MTNCTTNKGCSEDNSHTIVSDLFRVYFLHNPNGLCHFYLELLRPLESRDFEYVSDTPQSIRFMKDSEWYYKLKSKTRSNGDRYDLVYRAKQTIKLRYEDELTTLLHDNLSFGNMRSDIENCISSLYSLRSAVLHIKYNYSGCPDSNSRDRKDSRILSELELMVSSKGEDKLSYMYEKHIESLENKINHFNISYVNEIKSIIKNEGDFHSGVSVEYTVAVGWMVDNIVSKRSEIKRLEDEIKKLAKTVELEHKRVVVKHINSWDDIPKFVREESLKVVDDISLVGVSRLPTIDKIYIK